MRYAMLIHYDPSYDGAMSEDESRGVFAGYRALGEDSRCGASGQLQPIDTATTVRVEDGRTLTTDGPFADTKEVFGGYYVLDAADIDEAIDAASRIPAARMEGSVEVRPVVEL